MPAKSEYWVLLGIPLCCGILLGGVWQEIFGLAGAVIFPLVVGSALLTRRLNCSAGTGVAYATGLMLAFWVTIGFVIALMGVRPGVATGTLCGVVGDVVVAVTWKAWRSGIPAGGRPANDR
jgi:hypothetical protein